MKLENATYEEILSFLLKGSTYREIANTLSVSKNTVTNLVKRLTNTGTIYTSNNKTSIYDPIVNEVQEQIIAYLQLKKTSVSRKKNGKLQNSEIHLLLLKQGYNISRRKTDELIARGRKVLKESYLTIAHIPGRAVEFD